MKKAFYRLGIIFILTHPGASEPGNWLALSAQNDLLAKQLKGFANPRACQQAQLTYHDAALAAAKVSLGYGLLVSCLVLATVLWTIRRTEQGRLVLERQQEALPQVIAATTLLGIFMAFQGYQYHLSTKVIESRYQLELYKCGKAF